MANDDCHSEASDDLPLPEGWSVIKQKDVKWYAHHDSKIISRVHPTSLSKSKNESTPGEIQNGSLSLNHVGLPQEDDRPFDIGRCSPSSTHVYLEFTQKVGASQNSTVLEPQVGRTGVRGTSAGNLKVLVRFATNLPSNVHGVENVFVSFACRPQVELAKCRVVCGAHPVWDEEVAIPVCALDRAMMVEICDVSYDKSSNNVIARAVMNIDIINQVPCIGPLVLALMDDAGCELGADTLLTLQVLETPWPSTTPRSLQWRDSSSLHENLQEAKRTASQRSSMLDLLSFPNGSASAMAPGRKFQIIRQVLDDELEISAEAISKKLDLALQEEFEKLDALIDNLKEAEGSVNAEMMAFEQLAADADEDHDGRINRNEASNMLHKHFTDKSNEIHGVEGLNLSDEKIENLLSRMYPPNDMGRTLNQEQFFAALKREQIAQQHISEIIECLNDDPSVGMLVYEGE